MSSTAPQSSRLLRVSRRKRVETGYEARGQFIDYHQARRRWRVIVAHRRAGKTVATINQLIHSALTCPLRDPRCAYIAPLYRQAKDVAWTYLKQYSRAIPGVQINESELRVDYPNGGRVRLYGSDNPDGIRGIYLDDCVLDEYADMRPRMLPEIIRPALSDRKGSLTLIGTPRGHNAFYDAWMLAQSDPEWFATMLRASETGLVDEEELASARRLMTEEQYAQEYECSFEAAISGAYWGKEMAEAERQGRVGQVDVDPNIPVHTAWDLGVGDATAIWWFQVLAGGVHFVDRYRMTGMGLAHYADILKAKPYPKGRLFVPHDARVREWGSGRTRIEQMISLGLAPEIIPDHTIEDGIQAGRLTIPLSRFDRERCGEGIEALKQYRQEFDEERKVFRPKPLHDWTSDDADAFRYASMAWRAMKQPDPPPPPPRFEYKGIGQSGAVIQSGRTFNEMIAAATKRRKAED